MKRIFLFLAIIVSFQVAARDMALVTIPVACLREFPSHASQLVSQALLGTPVEAIDTDGEWGEVVLPDGYRGYISESSLVGCDYDEWLSSPRVVVTAPMGVIIHGADGEVVSPLLFGSVVELTDSATVVLPDGRSGALSRADVQSLTNVDEWLDRQFESDIAIAAAEAWLGAPYLWGGMSPSAMDCSGLVRLAWMACGRILPRDAWQQALEGEEVAPEDIRRGDLVFFDRSGNGRVTHVAIATDSLGSLIHSSGRVRRGSLDKESPDYVTGEVVTIRRIAGQPYPYRSERH